MNTPSRVGGSGRVPDNPVESLGFEIDAPDTWWSFAPKYYPDRFVQTKDHDLQRDGKQCHGENVSIKAIKNREFHASGIILSGRLDIYNRLMDYTKVVNIISPLTPDGGMECQIKHIELGEEVGYDPVERQRQFKFTIDLVSTGRDEYGDNSKNAIVTAIMDQ